MLRFIYIIILLSALLGSCSRGAVNFDDGERIFSKEFSIVLENNCSSALADFKIEFIEDVGAYLIFQVEMSNYDKDTLFVQSDDIAVSSKRSLETLEVLDRDVLITELEEEQENLKKTKKGRTIGNAIITGLEALSLAVGPGGNIGTAIFYAAESSIYIADERNGFKVAELSIEDEIKYLEDWVLDATYVLPEETITYDILINRMDREEELLFMISTDEVDCHISYMMKYD